MDKIRVNLTKAIEEKTKAWQRLSIDDILKLSTAYKNIYIITIILSIYFTIDDDLIAGVITFLCGVCVGSLLLLILAFISSCMPDNEYNFAESENKSIIALQDNIYLQRRHSDLKYVYMYKDNDGYKVDAISAQDATIIYDNEPRIVKQTGKFKNWYSWIYAIPVKTKNYIYVPKGSIQEEYDIDLRE